MNGPQRTAVDNPASQMANPDNRWTIPACADKSARVFLGLTPAQKQRKPEIIVVSAMGTDR